MVLEKIGLRSKIGMVLSISLATALLVSGCGGDDSTSPAVTGSAAGPAPLAPEQTTATTPTNQPLPALLADQLYVDNNEYDMTAGGSLPAATEGAAVTHHRITLNGENRTYTATAGHLTVRDPMTNAPTASVFYTAYTLDGADVAKRPVTFFFNGGPGSSSSTLHMGSFAPMRVFSAQGAKVSGPNDVTLGENPQTLLDKTDMVFVDPPGTGYSVAIAPKKNKDFWGVDADVRVNAGLVNRYLKVNNRGQSPVMLYGESYGGPRVGIMSYTLNDLYSIKLSGLLMQAPALNFFEDLTGQENSRRYPLPNFLLPTMTMTAQYWNAINDPSLSKLSLAELFQKSEDYAFNELIKLHYPRGGPPDSALVDGNVWDFLFFADDRMRNDPTAIDLAQQQAPILNAFLGNGLYSLSNNTYLLNPAATGSPADPLVVDKVFELANFDRTQIATSETLRSLVGNPFYTAAVVKDGTLGAYDLRKKLVGDDISKAIANYLTFDPSLADLGAYSTIFASYLHNNLKYQTVSEYQGLNQKIMPEWNKVTTLPAMDHYALTGDVVMKTMPFPDATIFIAAEMKINPSMQVLTSAGYYDGIVPAAKIDWDMQYVSDPNGGNVPAAQMQSNYTRVLYPGGHMGYSDDASRQQLHDVLDGFYAKATSKFIAAMTK